ATVSLLKNDSDVDGDALTVTAGTFSTTKGGTIVLKADGLFSYTPKADFTGEDTFTYTVSDGSLTSTAILTITVSNVNVAPVAANDKISMPENTVFNATVSLLKNDSDVDGDALTVTAGTFSTTKGGTIVLKADGLFSYTPKADFTGEDTFTYTVSDGSLTSTAILTITVSNVNVAPVAANDQISTPENTILYSTISLLANDYDTDADILSTIAGTYTTNKNGSLNLNSDGSYIYVPKSDFTGEDTVTYTITDGKLTAKATLIITVTKVNHAPEAVNDAISMVENTVFNSVQSLIENDFDYDGDLLSTNEGTFETNHRGTIILKADGSYTYTPKKNFTGEDTFTYSLSDGSLTDIGTLTITVRDNGDLDESIGLNPVFADINVNLYPTKVTDDFTIEINSSLFTYCNIYSSNGQFIGKFDLNPGKNTFNTNGFASGLYLIQIPYSQGVIVKRMVKI
ncbi:T9SS C-terminal target domain-containing protein, partial [Lutibacter sp. HS1-25]|uniref:tandem-95 repeat protein n=1 Tax=Lutibacter sp. HS1-25 TaxID=2485000 RepID=UPI001025229F